MSAIEFKDVDIILGRPPSQFKLENLNFSIDSGEFVVFVGPSGSGKSTVLRAIAGLEEITSGQIYLAGERIDDLEPAQRGLAMVFQNYALYPHMTAFDNMAFALKQQKKSKQEIQARVEKAAEVLQIKKLLDRKPAKLSGGQRQRVAIGRALVRNPSAFLLDEPLSNLDATLRNHMRVELADLHRKLGATMVYVTHDQVEAMTLADRIVLFSENGLQQIGKPQELFDRPKTRYVAEFLGYPKVNMMEARVSNSELLLKDGRKLQLPETLHGRALPDEITYGIRPRKIKISASSGSSMTIAHKENLGEEVIYHIRTELKDTLLRVMSSDHSFDVGHAVEIDFQLDKNLLFTDSGESITYFEDKSL